MRLEEALLELIKEASVVSMTGDSATYQFAVDTTTIHHILMRRGVARSSELEISQALAVLEAEGSVVFTGKRKAIRAVRIDMGKGAMTTNEIQSLVTNASLFDSHLTDALIDAHRSWRKVNRLAFAI